MGLGVRPQPDAAAGGAVGEALEIALKRVEIDNQRRGVDLVEGHADFGGRSCGHRRASGKRTREACAAGGEMQHGRATRPAVGRRSEIGRREGNMSDTAVSATEYALENQRIGSLQIRVVVLCTLIQICDGYDINSVAWAVPKLIDVWHLPPPAFTMAFLWSSIGILVGALSAGPIGDRIGRKPLLVGSLTIFGLASLGSAFAGSLLTLTVLRFFTGLGLGGGLPGAATLTGDYAPHRRRAQMIMLSFTGAPIGGFLCGQAAGLLLPTLGWPSIFVIGGIVPLALVVVMALWLPESPRILAAKASLTPREAE